MTKRTDFLRYGVRSLAGLVGAGIAAAVVAILCIVPLPGFTATARSELVTPTPTDQRRVCPGSLLDVMSLNGDVSTFAALGVPDYVSAERDAALRQSPLAAPDVVTGDSGSAPQQLFAPAPASDVAPLIVGSQAQLAQRETMSGLATAACLESGTDTWLVGGSTETGHTTLLLLSNPTDVTANVSVAVMGERGPVTGPGSSGIVVEPGSQRVISLASLAPGVVSPVVHVTSTGGQVVATLQQSVVRTLLPDGVETVSAAAAPNVRLVIPGVRLTGTSTGHHSEGGEVTSDAEPAIRVGVPGIDNSEVTVTVRSGHASSKPLSVKATVPAGRVLEMPFPELEDGVYTLVVTSTKPVVAAARTVQAADVDPFAAPTSTSTPSPAGASVPSPTDTATTKPAAAGPTQGSVGDGSTSPRDDQSSLAVLDDVGGGFDGGAGGGSTGATTPYVAPPPELGGDFTWFPAVSPLIGAALIAVPSAPHPTLTLFNANPSEVSIEITQDGTPVSEVTVPGESMTVLDLSDSSTFLLETNRSIYATLTFAGTGVGSSLPLSPASPLGSGLVVYPR